MEPFDLDKALAGSPVVTRDGREVTQLTLYQDVSNYPLVGVVDGKILSFSRTGRFINNSDTHPSNLFMSPTNKLGWVNVYWDDEEQDTFVSDPYESMSDAIAMRSRNNHDLNFLGCVQTRWEE